MTQLRCIFYSLLCSALLELPHPFVLAAQQPATFLAADETRSSQAWMLAGKPLDKIPLPDNGPFTPTEIVDGAKGRESPGANEPLVFQLDRNQTSAWMVDIYSGPAFEAFANPAAGFVANDWVNSLAGGATLYLTKSNTTAAQLMADLELSGSGNERNTLYQSGAQDFTVKGGGSHLFPVGKSQTYFLQFDLAGYQEWMVSPSLSLGGPFADHFPGYSISSRGLEATFSLPPRDAVFSVRYGSEHLSTPEPRRYHLMEFSLSWTW